MKPLIVQWKYRQKKPYYLPEERRCVGMDEEVGLRLHATDTHMLSKNSVEKGLIPAHALPKVIFHNLH